MVQIILIIVSFLVLVYIETEWLDLGNSIDYAGLNRFLALGSIMEIHHEEKYFDEKDKMINMLEKNILLIKNGGKINGESLKELPTELEKEWNEVYENYLIFRESIEKLDSTKSEQENIHSEIEQNGKAVIQSSDKLVEEITIFLEGKNQLLIRLEIALLITNTIVHIILVIIVFRIFNKEALEKIQLERFATIGKMGASIAHDLRNPLTVIKGSLEMLKIKQKEVNEFQKAQFDKISKAVDKIQYLTKDVLDFSKTSLMKKEDVELLEILNNSINEVEISEQIEVKLPKNNYKIKVDKIKIQTVITNLIKNAIDAIGEKGVIEIDSEERYDDIMITIKDTGKGIDRKDISKIFEPLYTTKQSGTGLGLANCKRIIEEHGGKIGVKINPTMFIIILPKK